MESEVDVSKSSHIYKPLKSLLGIAFPPKALSLQIQLLPYCNLFHCSPNQENKNKEMLYLRVGYKAEQKNVLKFTVLQSELGFG